MSFLQEEPGGKSSAGRILSFLIVIFYLFKMAVTDVTDGADGIEDIPLRAAFLAWGFYLVTRLDRATIKAILMKYAGIKAYEVMQAKPSESAKGPNV